MDGFAEKVHAVLSDTLNLPADFLSYVGIQYPALNPVATVNLKQGRYRKTTAKQVVNTVTETDLLNGEVTVADNALGTTGVLRLTAWGDSINNSGAARDLPSFKVKLGATTYLNTGPTGTTAWAANPSRFAWRVTAEIMNLGATNSQWASIDVRFFAAISSVAAGAFATGEGTQSLVGNGYLAVGGAAGAADTTASQALALSVINPFASASLDVTLKGALVEII